MKQFLILFFCFLFLSCGGDTSSMSDKKHIEPDLSSLSDAERILVEMAKTDKADEAVFIHSKHLVTTFCNCKTAATEYRIKECKERTKNRLEIVLKAYPEKLREIFKQKVEDGLIDKGC